MSYDLHDTIAAISSAPGGAARGVIRISGRKTASLIARCFRSSGAAETLAAISYPRRIVGSFEIAGDEQIADLSVPVELLYWPTERSYTRQPAAEIHTLGSTPLLSAMLDELEKHGVRSARPGEFTLRAFLAGRIDLTQAEGVLGVIDAQGEGELQSALEQVAGGLSAPLHRIREQLLSVLAELEAGLDFVEEDIEFISRDLLRRRIDDARETISLAQAKLSMRDRRDEAPRAVLTGEPNVGKSSLFNALVERYGAADSASSIVSPLPGATRDYVVARIRIDGVACDLIDTAGIEAAANEIGEAAQAATASQRRAADLRVACVDVNANLAPVQRQDAIVVSMKCDLTQDGVVHDRVTDQGDGVIACSSSTGEGIDVLARCLRDRIVQLASEDDSAGAAAATSVRCAGSLRRAAESLANASVLIATGGDELLAAEIRGGLDALGEIVGAICADDVLDRVFSQFCIGK